MRIILTKGTDSRPYVLTCERDDGTTTWQRSSAYFAYHDLIHYAVETTLGYREAFLGLVAQGKPIDDFGTRNGRRDTYTDEEAWAEGIVGLLQWPGVGGGPDLDDAAFQRELAGLARDGRAPAVTPEQLAGIRDCVFELHARWAAVPAGGSMELEF